MKPEDDTVSLVDVAVIFLRRWMVFVTVFLVVLAIGVGYGFTLKDTSIVGYTTTIQPAVIPGEDNGAELLVLIETKWMVEAEEEYKKTHGNLLVPVTAQKIQGTRLIELVTRGADRQEKAVVDTHRLLAERIVIEQNAALDRLLSFSEERLESVEGLILEAEDSPQPGDVRMKMHLRNIVVSGEAAEILMLAEKSIVEKAPSFKLVLALSAIIGLLLGCLAPFVLEFIRQVRSRLRELGAE